MSTEYRRNDNDRKIEVVGETLAPVTRCPRETITDLKCFFSCGNAYNTQT